ncbi:hypothetical protein HaLaN_16438, partial [Haematococcus lacustris]
VENHPSLVRDCWRRDHLTVEEQVAVALSYYAKGSNYSQVTLAGVMTPLCMSAQVLQVVIEACKLATLGWWQFPKWCPTTFDKRSVVI